MLIVNVVGCFYYKDKFENEFLTFESNASVMPAASCQLPWTASRIFPRDPMNTLLLLTAAIDSFQSE